MDFTLEMIRDALAAGGLRLETETPSARHFCDFRPLQSAAAHRDDCLYVTAGEAGTVCRAELSGVPAVLYAGDPDGALTLLSDRAEELRKWSEQVCLYLLQGRGLGEILNLCIPLFKNPLHIADSGFRTRAMSGNFDFSRFRDGEAAYLFEHGFHSPEYISRILDNTWFRTLSGIPRQAAILQLDFLAHRNILAVIGESERIYGYLTVIELEAPLTEGMVDLAEHLCSLLSILFAGEHSALQAGRDHLDNALFRDILRGDITDPAQITAAFRRSELLEVHSCVVAVLDPAEGASEDEFFLMCMGEQLSAGLPGCRCVLVDGCIAVVMGADTPEQARLRLSEACGEQLFLSQARRGFSLPFTDVENIRLYYCQARSALLYGPLLGSRHAGYEEVILYDLLSRFGDARTRRSILHPAIARLEAHDRARGSHLLDTLRELLRCHGDANAAAGRLYLHRNSMYYRINQITEVADVDLRDDAVLEHLSISLHIYDMDDAAPGYHNF